MKRVEKRLDGNYRRMLLVVFNEFWGSTPQNKFYGHLPSVIQTIEVRPSRHARYSWKSMGELTSDVLW